MDLLEKAICWSSLQHVRHDDWRLAAVHVGVVAPAGHRDAETHLRVLQEKKESIGEHSAVGQDVTHNTSCIGFQSCLVETTFLDHFMVLLRTLWRTQNAAVIMLTDMGFFVSPLQR